MPFPVERCIHELFEEQVTRTPEAAAIVFDSVELNYAELNDRANRLAHYLITLGVRPDARVAIAFDRSIEMVVALLATLKAGGAYVPLDPAYPAERRAFMIKDSAPCLLLTQQAVVPCLGCLPDTLPVLALDANRPPWARLSNSNPEPAALGLASSNLAYVIYTSGSTGVPKGVMIEHRGLVSSTIARVQFYKKYERFLLLSSISFDSSVAGIFGTLISGGSLFMPKAAVPLDPIELIRQIYECGITSLLCVPSLLNALMDDRIRDAGSSLQQIIVAGESCPPGLVDRVTRLLPNAKLYNEYGPTENTVWATVHFCSDGHNVSVVPIGRPIANTRIYILDACGQPVPVGVAGELYIGGAGVARGYLNRPELTAESFLPDLFAAEPARTAQPARLYRTGDLGRWLPDGTIEFLGRIDNQVKIRGFRIELGEIETALLKYPEVGEAVVLVREDQPGEKRLVTYFTGRREDISDATLRTHLASVLPEYMVPAAYMRLDALPLTPNGKLDRSALPPVPSMRAAGTAGRPPRSPDETLLCRLFARVTSQAAVDVNCDFFAIGGDSLAATILVAELRQLGRDLPLGTLYSARTPAAIAENWSSGTQAARATTRPILFLIPGSGGDEPSLAALRAEWADLLDCVTLDYPDWPCLAAPGFGMDDLVADLARRILECAPSGPLLLAGYSLGGFVAWALAKHLADTAQPVDVLFILDSDAGQPLLPAAQHTRLINRIYNRLHAFATTLGGRDRAERERMLGEFIGCRIVKRPALLRLFGRFRHLRLPPGLRYWIRFALLCNLQDRMFRSWQVGKSAAPGPLDCGKVVLFRAAEREQTTSLDLGWQAWSTELHIEEVAGDHQSMLKKRGSHSMHKRLPETLAGLSEATDAPPNR